MWQPGQPMEIGTTYISDRPDPPPSFIGGNYVSLPAGWSIPTSSGGLTQGLKDVITNQQTISNHDVISSIANITQSEKSKLEKIIEQQKSLTEQDAAKAKKTLDDMAKNAPLEYELYLAFEAQLEKKKAELRIESQRKILDFIKDTKEWKFIADPPANPYTASSDFSGPFGSKYTITSTINTTAQRDRLLSDDYKQTPSVEITANFINQFQMAVRNVLLYIRQQHSEVSKEITTLDVEINKLQNQIKVAAEKAAAAKLIADKAAADKAAADKLAEAKKTEADKLQDAILFTTNFYAVLTEKYGEKASTLAKELAESAKGKTIKNAEEAMAALEKYKDGINYKLRARDKLALQNALDSLDYEALSKNLAKFSKGFGGVSKIVDIVEILTELKKSFHTEDWKPFFIKVETVAVGMGATFVVALMFGLTVTTPLSIITFAILMALTSSYVDEKFIKIVNRDLLGL